MFAFLVSVIVIFIHSTDCGSIKNGAVCNGNGDCTNGHCSLYYINSTKTFERRCCSRFAYDYASNAPVPKTNADCCGNSYCTNPRFRKEEDKNAPCDFTFCEYRASFGMNPGSPCFTHTRCMGYRCLPSIDIAWQSNEFNATCCQIEDENDGSCTSSYMCCGDRDCINGKCVFGKRSDGSRCSLDPPCASGMCLRSPLHSSPGGQSNYKVCCSANPGKACKSDANCCYDNSCVGGVCTKHANTDPCWIGKTSQIWAEPDTCSGGVCGSNNGGKSFCCQLRIGEECSENRQCCDKWLTCYRGTCSQDPGNICVRGKVCYSWQHYA